MLNEIGSTFWEYSLEQIMGQCKVWWQSNDYSRRYFKSGRNAIKALARKLKSGKSKVLLPIYTCETVIQPFIDEGWNVDFYEVKLDLSIDIENLLIKTTEFIPDVIYVQSYFGFNTLRNSIEVLKGIHDKGVVLIEDITQSIFSNHYIPFVDYYVSSLRKFLAIPDGGVIVTNQESDFGIVELCDESLVKVAHEAFNLKGQYMMSSLDENLKEQFMLKYKELNDLISINDKLQDISEESLKIFKACDIKHLSKKRISNFNFLSENFKKIDWIRLVFMNESNGEVPLCLPCYVDVDRKMLQSYLSKNSIYCPVIWPKPTQILNNGKVSKYMYKNMLCFPIDQRYGEKEMERIYSVLNGFNA